MGFGVSGASAVIFLGLFVAAGTLYATTSNAAELVSDATDDDRERLLDRRNTALNVTDATYASDDTLTVTVENTGTHVLSVDATTVVVDDAYGPVTNTTVGGDPSTDLWGPGTALRLTLANVTETAGLTDEPARVTVVTGTGVSDAATVRRVN